MNDDEFKYSDPLISLISLISLILPDVRDGLTRKERIVLYCLDQIQKERKGRNVPTVMLYGRVVEHVCMTEQELQGILQRLTSYNSNPD